MKEIIKDYYDSIVKIINSINVSDSEGNEIDLFSGIEKTIAIVAELEHSGNKLMFIGNGGSAAIASHMSVDFWKNGGIKAIAFNDSSLLTCVSNDYSYEDVFEKPIEMFADGGDVLFAISSSGKSENIIRGVRAARKKGCKVITLSGFEKNNLLSSMGDYNFYVSAHSYGPVEIVHQIICHGILDIFMETRTSGE